MRNFTRKTALLAFMVMVFSLIAGQAVAQTGPMRASHRQTAQNAKNFIVTLNNGTAYYYLVSTETDALIELNGETVTVNNDVLDWKSIKSMRLKDMPRFFLDEDSTSFGADYAVDHGLMVLRHSMKKDQWNTIIIPVSLTGEQITETFGEGTQVANLKAVRENDNTTIEFETLDLNTGNVVMNANFCYLIRPTGDPDYTEDQRMTVASGFRPYGPIYLIPSISLSKSQRVRVSTVRSDDGNTSVRMRGTYAKLDNSLVNGVLIQNKKITAGTYSMNEDGLFAENQDSTIVKAFHAWIENVGATKNLKFYVNGAEEDITALADAIHLPEAVLSRDDADVYDVHGRRVARLTKDATIGSLNLPRGIYILRGRKYVIQ